MAGELVEVFGQSTWFQCGECPADFKDKKITVRPSDGEALEVDAEALCLAKRAFDLVADSGVDLPLKRSLVAKVVEYLQHHKTTPPAEIRTPLVSDNLVECGALKFDAGFVNVEKDLLFELLVAAIIMGIPSLQFLCMAKASLLIKGKAPDKLLKDFKLTNDLPEEEDEALTAAFAEQKEKVKATPDESGLGGVALLITSALQAADRLGVLASDASAASLKSFRQACWRALVLGDWARLSEAPEETSGDKDLVAAVLAPSRGAALELASEALRGDKGLVTAAALAAGPGAADKPFFSASEQLRGDRAFVLELVQAAGGKALGGASDALRGDPAFVLQAVGISGAALGGAADALREDKAFVLQCVGQSAEAMQHAGEELRNDPGFALKAVQVKGAALAYLPFALKAEKGIVAAAVESDSKAVAYAHTSARKALKVPMPWDPPVEQPEESAKDHAGNTGQPLDGDVSMAGPRLMAVPLSKEASKDIDMVYYHLKTQKSVQFSALSVMTANMGQANYIASNSYLDKMPYYERPEIDAVTLMWGAVGNIGMRWKAFASQDMLNANPEALMSVMDAAKALHMTTTRMFPPEWYAASFFDEWTRASMLQQTAGIHGANEDYALPQFRRVIAARVEKEADASVLEAPTDTSPLGGWPVLSGLSEAAEEPLPLEEGAEIMLTGLQAKNGTTGTLLKKCSDGRWRVRMGDGTGVSLLSESYFMVVSPPPAEPKVMDGAAAKRDARQKAIQERKERMARAESQQ